MIDPLDTIYDNMEIGKYDEAIELAKQELLKDKDNEFLFRKIIGKSLIDRYLKNQNDKNYSQLKEAIEELEISWSLQKILNQESLLYLADCEFYLRQYDQSIKHYEELFQVLKFLKSENVFQSQCNIGIGNCLMKKGNYKEAIVQFEQGINSTDGKDINEQESTLRNLVYCNFKLNNSKAIDKYIKQLLILIPKEYVTYFLLYKIFQVQNKLEEAEAIMQKFPEGQLNNIKHSDAKDYNQIIIGQQEEVQKQNQSSQELNSRLLIDKEQQKQQQQIEAIQTQKYIQKENPQNQDANLQSNYAHQIQKETYFKNAFQIISSFKGITNSIEKAIILNAQGKCCEKQKKFDQAEIFYQKCIEENPNYVIGWINKANLGIITRRFQQANENYQMAKYLYSTKNGRENLTQKQHQSIELMLGRIELYLQNKFQNDNIQITKKRSQVGFDQNKSNLSQNFSNLLNSPTHIKSEFISERKTYQNKDFKIRPGFKLPPLKQK
ncbi:unnamed protein product [Paramecium sonneborni]|uniref:Tetratricopeptide repeat protein n=1 Tax=Paramecium sonneborni TaxID=65129 RepID=A0A8S1PKW5_9CILI|nr:unnamed protein product [Paramecium sonneborni]